RTGISEFLLNSEFLLPNYPLLLALDPAFDIALLAGAHRQGSWRHVFANRRARADVRPLANRDRGDELGVATDERAVLDGGGVLVRAVVVARDRAGTDVDPRSDDGVPEIREVHGLRSGAE